MSKLLSVRVSGFFFLSSVMSVCLLGCMQSDNVRWTPLQMALFNPIQAAPPTWDVYGLRLDIPYGRNRNVYGLDAGLMNDATGRAAGLQAGVINDAKSLLGIQMGGGNDAVSVIGLQVSGLSGNSSEDLRGAQVAASFGVNRAIMAA